MTITISLNGSPRTVAPDTDPDMPLLWWLRDHAGLTGTKFGCGMGLCGACTVHVDGTPTRSYITPVEAAAGKQVRTIEAVGATPAGKAVQSAWIKCDVPQCSYCQSSQIMSATALLAGNKTPSDADIDNAMNGNICRCGTYAQIRDALKEASAALWVRG